MKLSERKKKSVPNEVASGAACSSKTAPSPAWHVDGPTFGEPKSMKLSEARKKSVTTMVPQELTVPQKRFRSLPGKHEAV